MSVGELRNAGWSFMWATAVLTQPTSFHPFHDPARRYIPSFRTITRRPGSQASFSHAPADFAVFASRNCKSSFSPITHSVYPSVAIAVLSTFKFCYEANKSGAEQRAHGKLRAAA
jgi:hypothetical protein